MKITVRLFIQKHPDRTYTVSTPAIPHIAAYGPTLEECKQDVAAALVKYLSEISPAYIQHVALRRDEQLVLVEVELRPTGPRGHRRRNTLRLPVHLLIAPAENGQILATVPRLTDPPLAFFVSDLGELPEMTQVELAQYFYGAPLEALLQYRANRYETIDELEVEFKPKKPEEIVAEQEDETFWALRRAGISLTAYADEARLVRAHRRDPEVKNVLDILAGERPNLVLIGPSGVGKTAIVHEIVHRIRRKDCPESLQGREVWAVTASALVAGTGIIGDMENRLTNLVAEVRKKHHILFVEDTAGLTEAGRHLHSETSMADFLRPHLQTGSVAIIGESTPERWRYAERLNPGFAAQFRTLLVAPTSEALTLSIVSSVVRSIEQREQLRILPAVGEAAVELTNRFQPYSAQPGKALRLIDQMVGDHNQSRTTASSGTERPVLGRKDVVATFTRQTGLPPFILADDVPLDLAAVHQHFGARVVGQVEAVEAMVNLIAMIKAGLNDPQKPLGSFLFIGPTGVGKTQMAKTLADYLFGDEGRVIRFDMSEYGDPAAVRRLIGMPGSSGEGEITGKVRSQPFCVLLLDEFEKAAPDIFDLFLQVLGEGRLTDATGATTSFQNTIIIMTSNLGASAREQRALGLLSESQPHPVRDPDYWQGKVEDYFRPEFVNRIDQIVAFQPLGTATMRQIAQRELGDVLLRKGITRRNLLVEIDDSVIDLLMEQGFSATYGARPLKRAIEQRVVLPLARFLAGRTQVESDLLRLGRQGNEVVLSLTRLAEAARGQTVLLDEGPLTSGPRRRLVDDRDLVEGFAELRLKLADWTTSDTVLEMRNERDACLSQTHHPTFWDDSEAARSTLTRFHFLERMLKRLQQLSDQAIYLEELAGLVQSQRDAGYRKDLAESFVRLNRDAAFLEIELLCAHIVANHNAMLTIGPLRTQAQDDDPSWTNRLAMMYLHWANRKGYDIEAVANLIPLSKASRPTAAQRAYPYRWQLLNVSNFDGLLKEVGELAELRELVILLSGANVYGFLKGEAGFHRRGGQRPSGERTLQLAVVAVDVWDGSGTGLLGQMLEARGQKAGPGSEAAHDEPPPPAPEIVRSYQFAGQRHVTDSRTKVRHNDLDAVLEGDLDDFILAHLRQIEPATAWEKR